MNKNAPFTNKNVVEITSIGNSCAFSALSIFLLETYLEQTNSTQLQLLTAQFNKTYKTTINIKQFQFILKNKLQNSVERQLVMAPVIKNYSMEINQSVDRNGTAGAETFKTFAKQLNFNVAFYQKDNHNNRDSYKLKASDHVISFIKNNQWPTMHVLIEMNGSSAHYNLVLQNASKAAELNLYNSMTSERKWSTTKGQEVKFRGEVLRRVKRWCSSASMIQTKKKTVRPTTTKVRNVPRTNTRISPTERSRLVQPQRQQGRIDDYDSDDGALCDNCCIIS